MRFSEFPKRREEFFQWPKLKGLRQNTLKNYRTDLNCFGQFLSELSPRAGEGRLDAAAIKNYGHYLDGRYAHGNSIRRRIQTLRRFFDFLLEKRIFASNLVKELPTSPKFVDRPRPTPCADVAKLWHHLGREIGRTEGLLRLLAKRNRILVLLVYGAGLKVSDLAQLRSGHILANPKRRTPCRVMLSPPRRDPYSVPLPRVFAPVFKDYQKVLEREKKRLRIAFPHALFSANAHRILSGGLGPRGVEMIFAEIRRHLDIQLTPKTLRQAAIMRWIKNKHGDSQVREWMGVTPRYDLRPYTELLADYPGNDSFLNE